MKSMTAYGQGESQDERAQVNCEIRTLNSRFIEVNVRTPRILVAMEPEIIGAVKNSLGRGKVDVFIDITWRNDLANLPTLDHAVAARYLGLMEQFKQLSFSHENKNWTHIAEPSIVDFFRLDGVLTQKSGPRNSAAAVEQIRELVLNSLNTALGQVHEAREKEGRALQVALTGLVGEISTAREAIEERVTDIRGWIHESYLKRLSRVLDDLTKLGHENSKPPEERLTAEICLLTDKADIEEELTRLKTHEAEFLATISRGEAAGRKLDFLCQEFHREVNTISSKLQQTEISQLTLDMKQAVERMRQQVQNIE